MNNIRTIEEYKEEVFDLLDEQEKLEWLYEMSTQINRAIEYIESNWINYEDSESFITFDEHLEVCILEIRKLLEILKGDKQ